MCLIMQNLVSSISKKTTSISNSSTNIKVFLKVPKKYALILKKK